MTYITPTRHEKDEWSRMAVYAYKHNDNFTGHRYSRYAALREGERLELSAYDTLMRNYREWLVFGGK